MAERFEIAISQRGDESLQLLSAAQQRLVADAIARHLTFEANRETRNRKPMRDNLVGSWELRLGTLRVLYDVTDAPPFRVLVTLVLVKRRNRWFAGSEELQL